MVRTTQEALEESVATTAIVLSTDCISDTAQYPPALRRMDVTPAALRKVQEHSASASDAFFVVDLDAVAARVQLWTSLLPQVEPFYAVKCNPDMKILELLTQLGCGFDCASRTEIDDALRAGATPDKIIYANPCKQASHIAFAAANDVHLMTFDSFDELDKLQRVAPQAQAVLRLYVDDSQSAMRLGTKFGALIDDAPALLAHAKALGVAVAGVSFHVGSGCFSGAAYTDAVHHARQVFDMGAALGMRMNVLDVGGGFPSIDGDPIWFRDCAQALTAALREHFPAPSDVRVIAEPGRFFVASSHTLAVNVIGRKRAPSGAPMYFVNDGLYGSFNGLVYDHPDIQPVVLASASDAHAPLEHASVWGPTCDGSDCVLKDAKLPALSVGDWIVFPAMGAYSCAASSHFNGFAPPAKVYLARQ